VGSAAVEDARHQTVLEYLDSFVRALGTPPIIMGHSFGGCSRSS